MNEMVGYVLPFHVVSAYYLSGKERYSNDALNLTFV